jgi:hypothetical protein
MPEGPECRILVDNLNKILVGTKLTNIEILNGRYKTHGPPKNFKKLIEEYATKLCATPYLLFPTYGQISFSYVLNLVAAPIINFRLVNRRRKIHGSIGNSFYEIQHDVFGHGRDTHKLDVLQDKYYKEWFNNISIVISTLFPFYNYKLQPYFRSQLKTQYVELDEEEKTVYTPEKSTYLIIFFINKKSGPNQG